MDDVDYDYAPRTYWPGEWTTELSTTPGSFHRWVKQGYARESAPLFGGTPFSLNAGEYLPGLEESEVEIARVELASATGDVKSVRARLGDDDLIHYRVVDEYGWWDFEVTPESSGSPLTMRELITLIDSVRWRPGEDQEEVGLTDSYRNGNLEGGCEPEELVDFVRVGSDYYPGLTEHYERDAERWLDEQLVALWEDGMACSCGVDSLDVEDGNLSHRSECRTARALRARQA